MASSTAFPRIASRLKVQLGSGTKNPKSLVKFVSEQCWADICQPTSATALISRSLPQVVKSDFKASPGSSVVIYPSGDGVPERLVLVGLGKSEKIDTKTVKKATKAAVGCLKQLKVGEATFDVGAIMAGAKTNKEDNSSANSLLPTVIHEAHNAAYKFNKYLKQNNAETKGEGAAEDSDSDEPEEQQLEFLTLSLGDAADESQLNAAAAEAAVAEVVANCTVFARDLGNERADVATPAYMADAAVALGQRSGSCAGDGSGGGKLCVRVLEAEELKEQRMELLLAVGQAATVSPRMVILEYNGAPEAEEGEAAGERVALLGKGITFDTGGLNLKPTGYMETMHYDMCGSSTVLATMAAAAQLQLPLNIVGAMVLAENAVGSAAYKPHSIIRSRNGLTVSVGNTDAEGRLALADGLSYLTDKEDGIAAAGAVTTVIDVATLTGACMVALGMDTAGLFASDDELAKQLTDAAKKADESVWHLPILPEHDAMLKSEFADVCSTGGSRYGGASSAAAFLKRFIPKGTAWAHLDVAGPASTDAHGCTGFGVRLLTEYLVTKAAAANK